MLIVSLLLCRLTGGIIWCLVVSSCVWLFRFCKILYNMFKYWEIRTFFLYALKISQVFCSCE